MKSKRVRRKVGDIVCIPLGDGTLGYGRVLNDPLYEFYELRSTEISSPKEVLASPVLFKIWVMKYAVTSGRWEVLGNAPLDAAAEESPAFFKHLKFLPGSPYFIYKNGIDIPATKEECQHLECGAVWEAEHVEGRLLDHFEGRENAWVRILSA